MFDLLTCLVPTGMATEQPDTIATLATEDERKNEELATSQKITRRYILSFYWVIILLVIPFWWHSTSIIRHSIPETRVHELSKQRLVFPVRISVDGPSTSRSLVLSELSSRLQGKYDNYEFTFVDNGEIDPSGYRIRITPCSYDCGSDASRLSVTGRDLVYQFKSELTQREAATIVDAATALLFPSPSSVKAQFSPRYRLAFSLLNENSATGGFAVDWDIQEAITNYLQPTLQELRVLHNFTIESHVQYHAPLAFDLLPTGEEDSPVFELGEDHLKTFVNSAEWTLSSSVNNDIVLHLILFIPSTSNRPMIVLKPDGGHSTTNAFVLPQWGGIVVWNPPFNADAPRINHYLNVSDLTPIFKTFRSQLHSLLGVPSLPSSTHRSLSLAPSDDATTGAEPMRRTVLSPWQLDSLLRQRIIETFTGAQDTLLSIVKLMHQIQNMPVKLNVREDIVAALDALQGMCPYIPTQVQAHACPQSSKDLASFTLEQALQHSSEAFTKASRAFFSPDMLAMLYFPTEHTFAVYTPLFLPIAVPFVALTLREFFAWRRERNPALAGQKPSGPLLFRIIGALRARLARTPKAKTE
ncbi:hypothetical protein DL93DRAFT_281068 [Clavulina sp. PMI_390]|nr:hypothetical protein DL93DRAFT_281068 [Clavulina sp. PMI_390]